MAIFLKMNPHIALPEDVTSESVIQWRDRVLQTAKPITWNNYLRHMRSIYNFALENEWIALSKNPFSKLTLRTGKQKRKTLTQTQLELIAHYLTHNETLPSILQPRWFALAMVNTFRYTGIRRIQLVQLRICDIDLKNNLIRLPADINKNHNYHEIPISEKLQPHLAKLISEMVSIGRKPTDQLFNLNIVSQHTKHQTRNMTRKQVSAMFRVLSNQLGFAVSPHRFRHTIATQLMQNANNLYNVKQLLGHSDIKVTMTYIEYNSEMIRDCVNSL